jgi:pantoate--beta-alanine ligase
MGPRVLESPGALRLQSERWRSAGLIVGIVPTMGALHAGHVSLVRRARDECDRVVVSIFVNPTQFGPGEDYSRYPRPRERDIEICAEERVDAVYAPDVDAMYPTGFATRVLLEGPLVATLEGAARPGHFAGVALAVTKLLTASRADRAYFGQKDAQQCAVVRRLAADLDLGVDVVVCPTVRDADGLALSSRNVYLSAQEREAALAIPRGLAAAAGLARAGIDAAERLVAAVREELAASPGLVVEYVDAVDGDTFEPVARVGEGARIQVAARIGATRLIDTLSPLVDIPPTGPLRAEETAGEAVAGTRSGRLQES